MAVPERQVMLSQAEIAVKTALKMGAVEAEAFVYEGKATSVGIERGQITKSNRIIDKGIGIRVQIQKAIGFAYTNMTEEPDSVEETAQKALTAARASKPDSDWRGFPEKQVYTTPEKVFDKKIVDLRPEDLVILASRMLEASNEADKRVLPIEGGAGAGYVSNAIANSNGVCVYEEGTIIECSLATVANEGNTVTPVCFEFNAERNYDVDPEWVGKEAARLSVSALKTRKVETKRYKLILTQFALQDLLQHTLINAVKADNVERNQSAFKEKLGKTVGSETLTIYDNGLLPGGLRTGVFDAEGVPHRKTLLLEKGVLRSFLYDSYVANKQGKQSTGNASRAGYLSTPNIEATNFHIMPGNKDPQDLMNEVSDGLLVYYLQGAHSSNPVSGEFSVVAAPAWKINQGNIEHATRGVMLAGNMFELLKSVSVVGNNERKIGQLVAPWIVVDNVKVIGK